MVVPEDLYERIYASTPLYGSNRGKKAQRFSCFLSKRLPPPATVLDAGCGRGHLGRLLTKMGYQVHGIDISPSALAGIKEFPTSLLPYSRLGEIGDKSFDAVCSMDVLEHLPDEAAAGEAIRNLARIARRFLLLNIGVSPSGWTDPKTGQRTELHTLLRNNKWWIKRLLPYIRIQQKKSMWKTLFYVGEVRE